MRIFYGPPAAGWFGRKEEIPMDFTAIEKECRRLPGRVGLYYRDLRTGERYGIREQELFTAASLIKLPIMAQLYRRFAQGSLSPGQLCEVRREDKVPSCGAVAYLHDGALLTLQDLCNLMIVISDNSAANMLARRVGLNAVNRLMGELGLRRIRMERLLYDRDGARKGRRNTVSPADVGLFFELLWQGKVVSPQASREMLEILKLQQIDYKITGMLPETVPVAHKTGEDTGITHDAGIVYAASPFVLGILSEDTDPVETRQFISRTAYALYGAHKTA